MRSFTSSLFYLTFSVLTFFSKANEVSLRHNVPQADGCPTFERITVTVTATVPGKYPEPTPAAIQQHPIPVEYKSCFDRNRHSFTYVYDHDGYHFGVQQGGPKTEKLYANATRFLPLTTSDITSKWSNVTEHPPSMTISKVSLTSHPSDYQTTKTPYNTYYNSTSVIPSYSPTLNNSYSAVIPTSSIPPENSTIPNCEPELRLDGASESSFNGKSVPFSLEITSCAKFEVTSTTAFANFAPVDDITVTPDSISFAGFSADYVLLSIFALDTSSNAIPNSYQLHFGSINMPILVLGPDSQPTSGVRVYANATEYPGVSQECITDASGQCSLTNLPPTTIGLVARTDDNSIAVNGLASTTSQVTLRLTPFTEPNGDSSFDVNNGTSGWTEGTLSQSLKIKRDTTLTLSTNGAYDLQSASGSFKVHPFIKTAYIKYKFITSEVPGGFFGTRYNDYYSVTIRSNTGAYVTVSNSMNALGLGAFDAGGATDWFTLSLVVPANTKSVDYNIGVSNVADNLYDSSIVVAKVGDLQCDQCGDCSSCPTDPMCQPSCKSPRPMSCDFYRSCAEGQLECGPSGYPLAYGEKNCNKFIKNIDRFSAAGREWIFGTMLCLQRAMVPVLQPCTATCSSFEIAALDSHPGCYVKNGFCGLQCPDVLATIMTVSSDLRKNLKQVKQTSVLCIGKLIQTLTGCTGDVVLGLSVTNPAIRIALKVVISLLNSL